MSIENNNIENSIRSPMSPTSNSPDRFDSIWRMQSKELRSAVKLARDAHDTIVPADDDSRNLTECQFCDRRFKPDRLVVHNRSCTSFNCARRVSESVNRKILEVIGKAAPLYESPTKISNSTCHPTSFSSYNLNLDQYPHALEKLNPESLSQCECCARTFLADRLTVHARSCTTEHPARSVGDCRPGDAYADRIALLRFANCTDSEVSTSSASTNWRAASTAFREAVRQDKQKEAEASPNVEECPHCQKKYREKAAARHIQTCERKWANISGKGSPCAKWRGQSLHFRLQLREAKESYLASVTINHWDNAMVMEG